ncbi:hypothetical protein H5410_062771 [Solanum commersonii]|uniref:Uncharacterized protein n=1 Tax=Solanum commersonii TaxID=4109 RepID=A0A9J5WBV8_SOLCO|nr:hypothetical protein H5410_062771 [Solanum commersonii]
MDKMGVHSPTNVERAIVPAKGTVNSVQTIAEPDPADSDHENIESRSNENDISIDQFNQHYDPNEDNDSGMSFDSIALHNLDT